MAPPVAEHSLKTGTLFPLIWEVNNYMKKINSSAPQLSLIFGIFAFPLPLFFLASLVAIMNFDLDIFFPYFLPDRGSLFLYFLLALFLLGPIIIILSILAIYYGIRSFTQHQTSCKPIFGIIFGAFSLLIGLILALILIPFLLITYTS